MVIPFERLLEVLKEEHYVEFMEWMTGQTVTAEGVYFEDFKRWLLKKGVID